MTTTQTQLRRDTATNLAAATPAAGEPFYDITNKHLGVGDGATAGGIPHASAADVQKQSYIYPTVGGTANAITLTNSPAVGSYTDGLKLTFKASSSNTSTVTVNVDGLGNKNLYKMNSGALTALASGDLISGGVYEIFYDGTQFQVKALAEGPFASGALRYLGTATASSSATIDLTSLLSSTYDDYLIVIDSVIPATSNTDLQLLTSSNNGSSFATSGYFYSYTKLGGGGASVPISGGSGATQILVADGVTNNTSASINGEVRFHNVNNAAAYKGLTFQTAYFSGGVADTNFFNAAGGAVRTDSSNAINAIRFKMSSGNIASGTFKVYGITKS
jgi:hypothetical protein